MPLRVVTEAVDKVQRSKHKRLLQAGDDWLKGTRLLWLTSQENRTATQRESFDRAYSRELETGKAWAFKELFRELWNHPTEESATAWFKDWYRRVIHSRLGPMKKVARTIRDRLANVVSYCRHGITNAVAEGINSRIQSIKRRVGGFRSPENYRLAIFFCCGGLELHPR